MSNVKDLFSTNNNTAECSAKKYSTSDLWRAAFLRAFGWRLEEVSEIPHTNRNLVVLSNNTTQQERDELADEILEKATVFAERIRNGGNLVDLYRNGEALVEPADLISNYKSLKNEFEQVKVNSRNQ